MPGPAAISVMVSQDGSVKSAARALPASAQTVSVPTFNRRASARPVPAPPSDSRACASRVGAAEKGHGPTVAVERADIDLGRAGPDALGAATLREIGVDQGADVLVGA